MPHDPRLHVLHADDDESYRLLVRRAITAMPEIASRCSLVSVCDGTEAVDYVAGRGAYTNRNAHPTPDLIILDDRMCQLDGLEALRAIHALPHARHALGCVLGAMRRVATDDVPMHGGVVCVEKPHEYEGLMHKIKLIIEFALDVLELPSNRIASITADRVRCF